MLLSDYERIKKADIGSEFRLKVIEKKGESVNICCSDCFSFTVAKCMYALT